MKAYAIFDGGGVKGAALAGCLKAALDSGVEFAGYGGTSAGSIVALLAAVGYNGDQLENVMLKELKLGELISDVRYPLSALEDVRGRLAKPGILNLWGLRKHRPILGKLTADLGFNDGQALCKRLLELVRNKLGKDLSEHFTFDDLQRKGLPPLKVVASDLGTRLPLIFSNSGGDERNGEVLDAIRASMSYPFVFRPVRFNNSLLVDGGLCSNLPIFLFDRERQIDRLPLLAFDLVTQPADPGSGYNIGHFCADMLDTALEAGDFLMRRVRHSSDGIYHIRITVPEGIKTLDFDLSLDKLQQLFDKGVADTLTYINKELHPWQQVKDPVEYLQTLYASARDVKFALEAFAANLQEMGMTSVRTFVMLPCEPGRRIVVYHHHMDADPDQDLDLAEDGGCSGKCWTSRAPAIANLEDLAVGDNYLKWNMTRAEQAKVRKDRKAMVSLPIFDRISLGEREAPRRMLGVLSADTDKSLTGLRWFTEDGDVSEAGSRVLTLGSCWANLLTRVLR